MRFSIKLMGQTLANARETTGWTQRDLAAQADTTQARISKIENGDTDPRLSTIIELSRTLGLELMLVPTKHLPAVNALIRQDRLDVRGRSSAAILDRLANNLVQLRQHYPENEDLRQLDRATRELKGLRLTDDMEKPLREVLMTVQRVSETPALIATLSAPADKLRRLRNERVHSANDDVSAPRPAYTLDDEDDIDE